MQVDTSLYVSVQDSGKSKSEFTTNGQCLTLGSRKIDCKQTHYTTFSIKSWIPVSSTDHLL
ncbi:MAG: hypothetical protein ACR5LA_07970 [Wolbachia sp.]